MTENRDNNNLLNLFTEVKDTVIRRIRGRKKEVALVLSSGGARGLAHIGAIEELLDRGYHIQSIAGTSMGALVGGMYASGHLETFREWMKTIDKRKIHELTDYSPSLNHLVKGKRIIEALMNIVPDVDIDELPIPYAAISTDWESGHEVVFRHGSLYQAIRASISLPAYLEPMHIGSKVLIDGGTTNPLPLNRVERKKGDLLVAINVCGHDYEGELKLKRTAERQHIASSRTLQLLNKIMPEAFKLDFNYYTLLNRTASIMIHQNAQLMMRICPPDILLDLPMRRFSGSDYDKSERLIALGRARMKRVLDDYES